MNLRDIDISDHDLLEIICSLEDKVFELTGDEGKPLTNKDKLSMIQYIEYMENICDQFPGSSLVYDLGI